MSKNKDSDKKKHNKWQEFAEQQANQKIHVDTDDDLDGSEGSEFIDSEGPELIDPEVKEESHEGLEYPSHEALEQELNALEIKANEYKDKAIRATAELENVRRRAERDVQNAHKFGSERLLNDLLPVVDSLVRGIEGFAPDDPHAEGLKLTLDILEKTLQKHGIKVINPEKGEAFNPEFHEAMTMQPAEGAKSNTVLQVLQKGYELNGRVLRAAMVIVAS